MFSHSLSTACRAPADENGSAGGSAGPVDSDNPLLHNQELAILFTHAREMMLLGRVHDTDLIRVVAVNPRYLEVVRQAGFMVEASDFAGASFYSIARRFGFLPPQRAEMAARYRRVIETKSPLHYDELTPAPNGTYHGKTTLIPITDAAGDCRFVLYTSQDITEHVRAIAALRDSEEKFAKAFRASPYPKSLTDLSTGRFIDVNPAFEALSGYRHAEAIGRTSLELGLWQEAEDRDRLLRDVEQEGRVRGREVILVDRKGQRHIMRCSCHKLEIGGRPCLLTVAEDLTEQREAERTRSRLEEQLRQAQRIEALGTVAHGIAHDFNNLLTAIIMNHDLAVMSLGDLPAMQEHLAGIARASGLARDLVRRILTFSRPQPVGPFAEQPLAPVVREAMNLVRASLPSSIAIVDEISGSTPNVVTDATQIHQVVMNLCTNAAHAIGHRRGQIIVQLQPRIVTAADSAELQGIAPGDYAQLTVSDDGPGMDDAVQARIFEPFFTTKAPGEGTGLGLSIVRGIVEAHRGAITVRSRPGRGTVFFVLLPATAVAHEAVVRRPASIERGHGERILIVDDEPEICQALQAILRQLGYHCIAFTDPLAALAAFNCASGAFDLLLTDRTMPGLSGPELAHSVSQRRPALPTVIMSGGHSVQAGLVSPEWEIVDKPLSLPELSAALRRALAPAAERRG